MELRSICKYTMSASASGKIVLEPKARIWCLLPYPNHSKGCPNFGKRKTCPPQALLFQDVFDMSKPMWMVMVEYDLQTHVEVMKERHPKWTERQLFNCLWWQPMVNKFLRDSTEKLLQKGDGLVATYCPEAMGVQVIETAKKVGFDHIQVPPRDFVLKISVVGYSK